jgi:NTP pyrophosphatase (non-canonical NTP hydrolase)
MAQFTNVCPSPYLAELLKDMAHVRADIESGALPPYEHFVWNLAKTMTTPGDEAHHAGSGMSGEAGEIIDITKKVWVYGKPLDVAHLMEELGDLRFYYQAMLNLLGVTDEMVRAQNMKKLRVRYADGKYSDAAAIARVDKALSAEGSKGTGTPAPRKFMGKVSEEQAAEQSKQNIHDKFDAVRNESLRQLRRDEQP